MKEHAIETRIKRAAILIGAGMAVQGFTLLRVHPLSFLVFLGVGCPLTLAGIVLYLTSLVLSEAVPPRAEAGLSEAATAESKALGSGMGGGTKQQT